MLAMTFGTYPGNTKLPLNAVEKKKSTKRGIKAGLFVGSVAMARGVI